MARDNEFQFIATNVEELEAQLTAAYEQITQTSVHPASPEKLFIQWIVAILLHERILNNYTGNQNIPSRAEGKNLDALGELFFMGERPQAQAATCTERFFISQAQQTAILIPKGRGFPIPAIRLFGKPCRTFTFRRARISSTLLCNVRRRVVWETAICRDS